MKILRWLGTTILVVGCGVEPTSPVELPRASMAITVSTNALTIIPSSPFFSSNNILGVALDGAPGFPSGSFASNGTAKTDMYFPPALLFDREVTVGEVARMSYWTKTGTTHAVDARDWYLLIYTKKYTGEHPGNWYGSRFGTEPYFSATIAAPANSWNLWSTDGSMNTMRFFESTQGAPGANFGAYTDPNWASFAAGSSLGTLVQRASQTVLFFSIQTASDWASGFTGQLDGFTVELTDGSVATVNFEPWLTATTKDDCKKGGWQTLFRADGSPFKNQGACVSYVNTGK